MGLSRKLMNSLFFVTWMLLLSCFLLLEELAFSPEVEVQYNSIEEIMARYINLPEHERGRLQNQEFLERALGRLKTEAQDHHSQNHASRLNADSRLEDIQQEIIRCKSHMLEMEKRLRCAEMIKKFTKSKMYRDWTPRFTAWSLVFEGDPSEITTLCEVEYREQILEQTLKHVRVRKHVLEKFNSADAQSSSQVPLPSEAINLNNMVTTNQSNIYDWLPPRDPQVPVMNFMNFNGLLQQRQNEQVNRPSVMEAESNVNVQRTEFGQMIDMNLSPWTQFYPAGNGPMLMPHPGERAFNDGYLPQFSP